jgi:hypothetical protein
LPCDLPHARPRLLRARLAENLSTVNLARKLDEAYARLSQRSMP